ncbi:acetyl-CoA carboxylase biotin carboxyl carrier protein subunit [Skermania sp. ID1734]|uniref:acetyl-CoA carboxylase biotin carboxyl carrier protein n=1 Tax=Skermania sp. ID1734 TaxID=2597516 RepID=UPI001180EB41|nr:biotin/lipoyl-containing protein [Skermania sp. ID1734]TSE01129.1 acetyl-CoA carboxylase biotin carboxyl carrier protein subunit [Skermania sp. ID1734]
MTTPDNVTRREMRQLLRTFHDSSWTAMTLDVRGMRITVGKNGPPSPVSPARAVTTPVAVNPEVPAPESVVAQPAATAPANVGGCVEVRSPTVGAFWTAPSPGEPPFVQVGQHVEVGQQLAIVEVMKLMNPVVATESGEIVQICAANSELVEFDQPLFLIRPSDG